LAEITRKCIRRCAECKPCADTKLHLRPPIIRASD
jgi:hypothetical protein